jgi:L,D-transpeptidase YbiS
VPTSTADAVRPDDAIVIDVPRQRLVLWRDAVPVIDASVSTAARGVGEQRDSGCTPRGLHAVRAKVGAGCAEGAVFVGRRPTGEIYSSALAAAQPARDWILTRILWLTGREPGRNRGSAVDTLRRCIYIHGCPDDAPMGVAQSHGCIRMRNADVMTLFDAVAVGTSVRIDG